MKKRENGDGKFPVVSEDGSYEGEDDQINENDVSLRIKWKVQIVAIYKTCII